MISFSHVSVFLAVSLPVFLAVFLALVLVVAWGTAWGPGWGPVWGTPVNPAAVLVPLLVAGVGFVVYCLIDLARADEVRNLPRWLWAILCLNVAGGVAYLAAGRVRTAHEYERGRRTALDTIATAGYLIWPALGDPTVPGFDLQRWAESQQIAVRDAAAQSGTFRLPAWFTPLADDLGRLLDPVGYDRWWFTPTAPFVRGYQAGLAEARQAAVRAHDGGGSRD